MLSTVGQGYDDVATPTAFLLGLFKSETIEGAISRRVYELDEIQEGAKPQVTVDPVGKKASITNLWVSNHYDEPAEIPSAGAVSTTIINSIWEILFGYKVSLIIHNAKGEEETFVIEEVTE